MNNVVLSRLIISTCIITTLLSAIVCLSIFNETSNVDALVVDVDEPPTNATEELDVKIDATELLPLNGTIIVDIAGADDIDIEAIPPEGISVIITNTTVTTNSPVDMVEGEEVSNTTSIVTGTSASSPSPPASLSLAPPVSEPQSPSLPQVPTPFESVGAQEPDQVGRGQNDDDDD